VNWLSPKTISKRLDMSVKTVHRMIERGELPCIEFHSGRKRVSEMALERFLKNLERKQKVSGNGNDQV
jgi:excisionase family DNA binding protein